MFQAWRIQLRAAEQALRAGRLDEAARIVCQGDLPEFLPGKQLQAKIASSMLSRGKQSLERAESSAGWRDLASAERMGAAEEDAAGLRRALIAHTLQEADSLLAADDPLAAIARLDVLKSHRTVTMEVRRARQAAAKALEAQRFARQGNFAEAATAWTAAATLRPELKLFALRSEACRAAIEQARKLAEDLHAATTRKDWTVTLRLASQWLEISPECVAAQSAWRRAWSEVGTDGMVERKSPELLRVRLRPEERVQLRPEPELLRVRLPPIVRRRGLEGNERIDLHEPAGPRFLLWIDGVGGYLVCESREVVIGQPVPDFRVDLPIQGDLSRQHAVISRDGEGYLLAPRRRTQIDGRLISGPELLTDGCRLELGTGVRLNFFRPHPLSASARLEFASHHRTRPSADGVLLMAESLALGPAAASHVVCPDWKDEIVIFRQNGELFCRAQDAIEVDGALRTRCAQISLTSRVVVGERSLSLEKL